MRTLATILAEPITVEWHGVPTTCTHQLYGFNYQEAVDGATDEPIVSFKLLGVLNSDGAFVACSQPEYGRWNRAEYESLLNASGLSVDGDFLMSEVIAQHETVLAQQAAERLTSKRI